MPAQATTYPPGVCVTRSHWPATVIAWPRTRSPPDGCAAPPASAGSRAAPPRAPTRLAPPTSPARRRSAGGRGAAPGPDGGAHPRRAGADEGRRDEDRSGRLVRRLRRAAARGPPAPGGEARRAARLRAAGVLRGDAPGARARPRRAARGRVRRVRAGGVRGRLDRPGVPRAPARRAPRGGEDPVPGHRPRRARRPPEPGPDPARGEDDGPRHGPEGDGGRDPGAPHRGAGLRARGPDAPRVRAHLARPPLRRDPGGGHEPVERARAGHRVRRGPRLRAGEGAARRPSATGSARSCSGSSSGRCTGRGASRPIRTRATTCCCRTAGSRSSTSAWRSRSRASRSTPSWP